jgi:hypothetical protein
VHSQAKADHIQHQFMFSLLIVSMFSLLYSPAAQTKDMNVLNGYSPVIEVLIMTHATQ